MLFILLIPLVFISLLLILPLCSLLFGAFNMGILEVVMPILSEKLTWLSFFSTFNLAITVTFGSLILAILLSYVFSNYKLPAASILKILLIVPIIVPPFVAGIGFKKIFSRFGPLNSFLIENSIISQPVDWLGQSGFWGVALAEILHYYPIIFLSLLASCSALDYSLIQAAKLAGATKFKILIKILLPLFLPSTLAAMAMVFVWSFSELGTPLVFDYRLVLPIKLFDSLDQLHINPRGYVYVLLVLSVAVTGMLISRNLNRSKPALAYAARSIVPIPQKRLSILAKLLLLLIITFLVFIFLISQIGVLLLASTENWSMTALPQQFTFKHFQNLSEHPLVTSSILTSLGLAISSCILIVLVAGCLFYALKSSSKLAKWIIDASMLTFVIPGVVMAFAYIQFFRDTILDPRVNPLPLLALAYATRRLPVVLGAVSSANSVSSVALEEAAKMSAATKARTFFSISLPLAIPFLVSALILCFVFAMFEVSETLMLAQEESYFPISKTIYALLARPDAPGLACALGTLAFCITLAGMLIAAKVSGRKFEDLFKIN